MRFVRQVVPELMDRPDADPGELARSLLDLRGVNRWLGGRSGALRRVMALARATDHRPVRLLDVGTGGADIPLSLAAAGRRENVPLEIVGLDMHPTTAAIAREAASECPEIEILVGDALALPFLDGTFDIVMCHTTLHHFDAAGAKFALREMDRVARGGVVVTDLARSRLAYLGALMLAATVWRRHPITRHDGPRSVRAAFTPAELRRLGTDVFGPRVIVRREPVFRHSLVVDRRASEGMARRARGRESTSVLGGSGLLPAGRKGGRARAGSG